MRLLRAALCAGHFLVWPRIALQQPQAGQVTKEGHPNGPSSTLRVPDAQAGVAFPEGTSMCRPETSRIVRAALRVFAPPDCRASTGRVEKIKSIVPKMSNAKNLDTVISVVLLSRDKHAPSHSIRLRSEVGQHGLALHSEAQ